MAKLIALYHPPADPAAFDAYFATVHVPLAKKIPGLRSAEMSTGPVGTPEGPAPYHAVGILTFGSMADLQAGLATPEGEATVADVANFATGGVTVLVFEHREM
jgi:uncharacterized protein (TIGR02118 family)